MAGFFENFAQNRVQIIGKAEHLFIEEVEKDVENAKNIYKRFIGAGIPVIVFCRNLHPSEMMIKSCQRVWGTGFDISGYDI